MELTDNDRQRIEQEINTLYKTYFRLHSTTDLMVRAAEYATRFEREQQANGLKSIENPDHHIKVLKEQIQRMEKEYKQLEAERSEVIEKMTELLKAFNDSDKNYADWVATKELYMAFTGVNNLLERLNSLKTK